MKTFGLDAHFLQRKTDFTADVFAAVGQMCIRDSFKIVLDFESKKVRYFVDDMFGAELPLTAKYIKFYRIGTFAGSVIDVTMGAVSYTHLLYE